MEGLLHSSIQLRGYLQGGSLLKSFGKKFAASAILLGLSLVSAHAQDAGQPASQQVQPSAAQQSPPVEKPAQSQNPTAAAASSQNLPDKVEPRQSADLKNAENPKRILGILPNFISANDTVANQDPMTVHEKYVMSFHQMFDFSAHLGNLLQSAISQASNGQLH